MASTVLRTLTTSAPSTNNALNKPNPIPNCNFICLPLPLNQQAPTPSRHLCRIMHHSLKLNPLAKHPHRLHKFLPFAINAGAADETTVQYDVIDIVQNQELEDEETSDAAVDVEGATDERDSTSAEEHGSITILSLQLYREALENNNDSKLTEIEGFLKSIEDEKKELERKVASLSEELSSEKERVLSISAYFNNFRKTTEGERLSLVSNARGEVVETLLQVLDSFDRAKSQIKIENEGEGKISNSYQSIYKQFVEILGSLGVLPVDTVGKPFNSMVNNRLGSQFSRAVQEVFHMVSKACSGVSRP